jgi:aldehyde dehydrogenase (NAD+)
VEVHSPVDGSLVSRVAIGDQADVDAAVRSARRASAGWARLSPRERGRVLLAIEHALREQVDQLLTLEQAETGKPPALIRDELAASADYFGFYAAVTRTMGGETFDVGADRHVFTAHEPFGVVAVITPWNYSVNQAARSVAPALAAGNAVVLKPSEWTSSAVLAFAELATVAGLTDGLLNVVTGDGPHTGAAVVEHPLVGKVTFTGSVAGGRAVAARAAARLIPVTLELGGKSPHIVFADADLELAAQVVGDEFLSNTGQTCSAGTRMLVQRPIHDELLEAVTACARAHRPGRDLGPIITEAQFQRVDEYFAVAAAEGAVATIGGATAADPSLGRGRFVEPTVYAGVSNDMRIAREEVFGPVLTVSPFEDERDAIAIANDSSYGLVAGVWTRDLSRGLRVARALQAGQVYVNGWGAPIEAPFGGYKDSGYGREKGRAAIAEYTQVKTIASA